jgi:UPF0755 protein
VNASDQPPDGNGRGRPPAESAAQPAQPVVRPARPTPGTAAPPQRPAANRTMLPQQPPQSAQSAVPRAAAPPSAPPDSTASRVASGTGERQAPLRSSPFERASSVDARPIAPRSPRAALQPDHVPLPTLRSRRARNPVVIAGNILLTLVFLLTVTAGVGFVIGKQRFEAPGPLAQEKIVNVPRGGIRETAGLLVREGVIDRPLLFVAGTLLLKTRNDLKYGEYQFRKNASLSEVVDTLIEGKVVQHTFTIPEGQTSDQVVQRLLDNDVLVGNIREIPREGTLLPETYQFTRGTTREQMIQRMQEAQRRALNEIWERRVPDLPIRTAEQLVVLASIIEKETGRPEERTRVSAVFINRLHKKMKLQSDPTIIYGLVGGKGSLGRPIMKSEIDQPTPYNTYVIDGLPPGPIANPGRASLEAAANPARTKELYFVADGNGGHAFADTYEQHQRNVARLRAIEKQDRQMRQEKQGANTAPAASPRAATTRR